MKPQLGMALAALAGIGIGAAAVEGLRAQAKPPVYHIAEIDVTDVEAYTKEYAPKAQALIKASGGKLLAAGQNVTPIEGDPPKNVVAIQQWESMEKIQAWRSFKTTILSEEPLGLKWYYEREKPGAALVEWNQS